MAEGNTTPSGEIVRIEADGTDARELLQSSANPTGEDDDRTGPRELLRAALVNDEDPRFPWWLLLPGIALALGWGAWQAANADGSTSNAFLDALVWPGLLILALATLATFFGWQLDID